MLNLTTPEKKLIFFDTDKDFYDFAVFQTGEVIPGEHGVDYYSDLAYTKAYLDAVDNGMIFIIKDPNSQIYKRGCISTGKSIKQISNLEYYYPEIYG